MFRLSRVIFRLELYLFAVSLCSFWDPRRVHVFCIDVIYCIIIVGCNICHCYGIDADYSTYIYFFSPGATTLIGGCILQPSSGL